MGLPQMQRIKVTAAAAQRISGIILMWSPLSNAVDSRDFSVGAKGILPTEAQIPQRNVTPRGGLLWSVSADHAKKSLPLSTSRSRLKARWRNAMLEAIKEREGSKKSPLPLKGQNMLQGSLHIFATVGKGYEEPMHEMVTWARMILDAVQSAYKAAKSTDAATQPQKAHQATKAAHRINNRPSGVATKGPAGSQEARWFPSAHHVSEPQRPSAVRSATTIDFSKDPPASHRPSITTSRRQQSSQHLSPKQIRPFSHCARRHSEWTPFVGKDPPEMETSRSSTKDETTPEQQRVYRPALLDHESGLHQSHSDEGRAAVIKWNPLLLGNVRLMDTDSATIRFNDGRRRLDERRFKKGKGTRQRPQTKEHISSDDQEAPRQRYKGSIRKCASYIVHGQLTNPPPIDHNTHAATATQHSECLDRETLLEQSPSWDAADQRPKSKQESKLHADKVDDSSVLHESDTSGEQSLVMNEGFDRTNYHGHDSSSNQNHETVGHIKDQVPSELEHEPSNQNTAVLDDDGALYEQPADMPPIRRFTITKPETAPLFRYCIGYLKVEKGQTMGQVSDDDTLDDHLIQLQMPIQEKPIQEKPTQSSAEEDALKKLKDLAGLWLALASEPAEALRTEEWQPFLENALSGPKFAELDASDKDDSINLLRRRAAKFRQSIPRGIDITATSPDREAEGAGNNLDLYRAEITRLSGLIERELEALESLEGATTLFDALPEKVQADVSDLAAVKKGYHEEKRRKYATINMERVGSRQKGTKLKLQLRTDDNLSEIERIRRAMQQQD